MILSSRNNAEIRETKSRRKNPDFFNMETFFIFSTAYACCSPSEALRICAGRFARQKILVDYSLALPVSNSHHTRSGTWRAIAALKPIRRARSVEAVMLRHCSRFSNASMLSCLPAGGRQSGPVVPARPATPARVCCILQHLSGDGLGRGAAVSLRACPAYGNASGWPASARRQRRSLWPMRSARHDTEGADPALRSFPH